MTQNSAVKSETNKNINVQQRAVTMFNGWRRDDDNFLIAIRLYYYTKAEVFPIQKGSQRQFGLKSCISQHESHKYSKA